MTAFPGSEQPLQRGPDDLAPLRHDLRLFARVEDLVGEERALLRIPDADRSDGERDRLHAIGAELDRIFETLRERAERLGRHDRSAQEGA
jgi:hypothetical protein